MNAPNNGATMPDFSIDFAAKLSEVAEALNGEIAQDFESARTTLYLSRLSMEIALKSMLEKAGVPERLIRGRSHNLDALLGDLSNCEVEIEVVPLVKEWVTATGVRAITIQQDGGVVTVGEIIDAEVRGASKYPNQIRYGSCVVDFSPQVVAECSRKVVEWVKAHWHTVRTKNKAL